MKMKHYLYVACMFIAALAFTACSDDDDNSVKLANVTLHFNAPSELQSYNPTIGIQELTLKNINTGETTSVVKPGTRATTSNASITVSVPEGLYTISMEGSLSYKLNDEMVYTKMRAYQESVTFTEATGTSPLDVTGYVTPVKKEAISLSPKFSSPVPLLRKRNNIPVTNTSVFTTTPATRFAQTD